MAEVIKYGLLWDKEFLEWLDDNMQAIMQRDKVLLSKAILRSCEIKADVVAQDEKESGVRALLNLGHTFGHAIETEMGYGEWLHGEAVAAGMVMAAEMSRNMQWLNDNDVAYTRAIIAKANLPVDPPVEMTPESFRKAMSIDKKVLNGVLRLILMKELGNAIVTSDFTEEALQKVIA